MKKTFTRTITTMMAILIVLATFFTMTGCKNNVEITSTPDEVVVTETSSDELTYSETTSSETMNSETTSSEMTNPTTTDSDVERVEAPTENRTNSGNTSTSTGSNTSQSTGRPNNSGSNVSSGNSNSISGNTGNGTTQNQHVHSYGKVVVKATCTKDGYTTYSCACGKQYTSDYTDKLGHKWSSWTTVKEATTSSEGKQQRTCSRCNKTESKTIDKIKGKYDVTGIAGKENLLEERILYYINQYKNDNCAPKEWKMQQYADMRAVQLASNFSHDIDDIRETATSIEYGRHVVEKETIYDYNTNQIVYTGNTLDYWQPACTEAIGWCSSPRGTIDEIAKEIAEMFYNSAGHWRYIGADDTRYLAVGVYYYDHSIYTCVAVSA